MRWLDHRGRVPDALRGAIIALGNFDGFQIRQFTGRLVGSTAMLAMLGYLGVHCSGLAFYGWWYSSVVFPGMLVVLLCEGTHSKTS